MTPKDRIIDLIEAYAIAKTTANSTLISLSASALKTLLDGVDIQILDINTPAQDSVEKRPTRSKSSRSE
jgi:hypothetical protein